MGFGKGTLEFTLARGGSAEEPRGFCQVWGFCCCSSSCCCSTQRAQPPDPQAREPLSLWTEAWPLLLLFNTTRTTSGPPSTRAGFLHIGCEKLKTKTVPVTIAAPLKPVIPSSFRRKVVLVDAHTHLFLPTCANHSIVLCKSFGPGSERRTPRNEQNSV